MPALVSLAMITSVTSAARADLQWEAPASCPELPASDAVSSDVSLRAEVEQTASGFEMVLTTDDGATQRIAAPTCGGIGRSTPDHLEPGEHRVIERAE
jgi:hypothetical protein